MTENNIKSVFISGNLDLSDKQFIQYYLPIITELVKDENICRTSDDDGCSEMVQVTFNKLVKDKFKVSVYCVGDNPKHFVCSEFFMF